jgi:hypothetical protein
VKKITQKKRSTLPKLVARRRYVEIGELVALQQIQKDSQRFGHEAIAVGPFGRLDAGVVAAHDGKTRGAITNLFGSQAAFQAETMAWALNAGDWIAQVQFPALQDCASAEEWIDAFCASQSARGPRHGARPAVTHGSLWALWLSAVPYGLWSEQISRPSMAEHVQWIGRLEQQFEHVLDHFGLTTREGTSVKDLAGAFASLIEGVWLNQCLTKRHPCDPSEPIATALRRSGLLLWRGATELAKRP